MFDVSDFSALFPDVSSDLLDFFRFGSFVESASLILLEVFFFFLVFWFEELDSLTAPSSTFFDFF